MRWHKWVVLIAGSTGSALRAVRSSNLHITPDARRDLVLRRQRDGLPVTLALSHHGPGHSGKLVGKRVMKRRTRCEHMWSALDPESGN
jgi:hypothetical protein